jgi:dGTPase
MFDRVYLRSGAADEQRKAVELVRALFRYYLEHADAMPAEYRRAPGDLPDQVADYIAGMTDRYALRTYEQLFLPQGWLL